MTLESFIPVFVLALLAFMYLRMMQKNKSTEYQYTKKSSILSQAERDFYIALSQAVNNEYHIFTQIHLDALADCHINGKKYFGAFRHINEKSVDFVLCNKSSLSPVLAIELDDRSHFMSSRRDRDEVIEEILREINLPLLRIVNHGEFNALDLSRKIKSVLR